MTTLPEATPASGAARPNDDVLLEVKDLKMYFPVSSGMLFQRTTAYVKAVDGVSFQVKRGETLGLVGESGCGKSTTGRAILQLQRPTSGQVHFDGQELTGLWAGSGARSKWTEPLWDLRRRMQMIFQDPFASLNPRWRVANIVAEPIRYRGLLKGKAAISERVGELLAQVGLSASDSEKYPHEFSGGQRQRISIARALAGNPEFLVCDEPTSALDVSVQAQILNLMGDLQKRLGLTYLFISHNLAVVYHVSDKIGVMYLGRLCEIATAKDLFRNPKHPYTRLLLDTIPDMDMSGRERTPVRGEVPNPIDPPSGCTFHPRCPLANERCRSELPRLRSDGGSSVACHAVEENRHG